MTTVDVTENRTELCEFRSVSDDDASLISEYLLKYPSRSCDFTLGGILLWKEYFDYRMGIIDDSLVLTGIDPTDGCVFFHTPCGPMQIDEFQKFVDDYCRHYNVKARILLPEESDTAGNDSVIPDAYAAGWMEYLYEAQRFVTFAGRKMEKKRNHLNFFRNNFPDYQVVPITEAIIPDLIDFTLSFEAVHNDSSLAIYESSQMIQGLRNWRNYRFDGIAIYIGGKITGYSFGEKNGDTFIIHAEKGNVEYRGIYQAIASELCKHVLQLYPEVSWLNREDDMGDEGLRESKMSYHPSRFINKRIINCG